MNPFHYIAGAAVLCLALVALDHWLLCRSIRRILTPPKERPAQFICRHEAQARHELYTRTDGPFPHAHAQRIAGNLKASGIYASVQVIPAGAVGFFHVETLRK